MLILAVLSMLMQCDGNQPPPCPQPVSCGNFMALKNGQEWQASATATFTTSTLDSASVMVEECTHSCNEGVEWLSINRLPLRPGTYSLGEICWNDLHQTPLSAWFYTVIGTTATQRFNLCRTPHAPGYVTVSAYDAGTKELRGQVTATFVADPERQPEGGFRRDTIRIVDADFTVQIASAP